MAEQKEIQQLKNRFHELADKSYHQNCYTFTNFLGLSEQDTFQRNRQDYQYAGVCISGGLDLCERVVIRFGKEEELMYEQPFPICCIKITPLIKKFSEQLTHRDYLGALMNLGIERSMLGDIFIMDTDAYVFCLDSMADYIIEHLDKVRHTSVRCILVEEEELGLLKGIEPDSVVLQVSSERVDAIIAKLYNISRSDSLELFRAKKVFVGGRCIENNSYLLKEADIVSVRGFGRFVFQRISGETRKGKLCVQIDIYGRK